MIKEEVGQVTEEEKQEILNLFERKNALQELIPSLNSGLIPSEEKEVLYEKLISDLGKTNTKFSSWWAETSKKYEWKLKENGKWNIDFETNAIYLIID